MRKVILSVQCSLIKSVKHFILIWIVFYAVRTQNIVFVYEIHKYTCKHTCTKYVMPIIACQINQHQIVKKSSLNSTLCYRLIDHKNSCNIKSEKQVV